MTDELSCQERWREERQGDGDRGIGRSRNGGSGLLLQQRGSGLAPNLTGARCGLVPIGEAFFETRTR